MQKELTGCLLGALACVLACGTTTRGTNGADSGPGTPGVNGNVSGATLSTTTAVAIQQNSTLILMVTDVQQQTCELVRSDGAHAPRATWLEIDFQTAIQPPAPLTYDILHATNGVTLSARMHKNDGVCNDIFAFADTSATSGTVTITKINATQVEANLALTFAGSGSSGTGGSLAGNFVAPFCDPDAGHSIDGGTLCPQ